MKCPKCGCNKFMAEQHIEGTISVIVTLADDGSAMFHSNRAMFHSNPTNDGNIDSSELSCDSPEGPFACLGCEYEMTHKDLEKKGNK